MKLSPRMRCWVALVLSPFLISDLGCPNSRTERGFTWDGVVLPHSAIAQQLVSSHGKTNVVKGAMNFYLYAPNGCWIKPQSDAPAVKGLVGEPLYELAIVDTSDDVSFFWLNGTQPTISDQGGSFTACSTGTSFIVGRFRDHDDADHTFARYVVYAEKVTSPNDPIITTMNSSGSASTPVPLTLTDYYLTFTTKKVAPNKWETIDAASVTTRPIVRPSNVSQDQEDRLAHSFGTTHSETDLVQWLFLRAGNVRCALDKPSPTSKP